MTRSPVSPRKELGQHFLIDENILRVIERLADLAPGDVVLEIGPGLGVLTAFLADRVSHVHAIEIDHSLEEMIWRVVSRYAELAGRPSAVPPPRGPRPLVRPPREA